MVQPTADLVTVNCSQQIGFDPGAGVESVLEAGNTPVGEAATGRKIHEGRDHAGDHVEHILSSP